MFIAQIKAFIAVFGEALFTPSTSDRFIAKFIDAFVTDNYDIFIVWCAFRTYIVLFFDVCAAYTLKSGGCSLPPNISLK
jgi:hypothetical protein